jgi:hypothetical protein
MKYISVLKKIYAHAVSGFFFFPFFLINKTEIKGILISIFYIPNKVKQGFSEVFNYGIKA